MPRIPRRWKDGEGASTPVEPVPSPTDPGQPTTTSGDPLAGGPSPATSGGPLAPSTGAVSATEAHASGAPAVAPDGATVVSDQQTVVVPAVAAPEGVGGVVEQAPADATPRFRERTRMRRRLRYLRRLRELAFRDLGGLVFDLHRFGRDRGDLVAEKLDGLARIDLEQRTIEGALRDRRDFTELREPGIAACPRCQTLHDTDANFCPGCGTSLRGSVVRDASPVSVTPADDAQGQAPAAPQPAAATQPDPQPTTTP